MLVNVITDVCKVTIDAIASRICDEGKEFLANRLRGKVKLYNVARLMAATNSNKVFNSYTVVRIECLSFQIGIDYNLSSAFHKCTLHY
jgi:hypothetical protein